MMRSVLATLLAGSLMAFSTAAGQEKRVVASAKLASGALSFDGHATAGDFVGKTTTVTGQLTGASDVASVRGWVEAPVNTLTTGNNRRDKDLNKSMESDKYPLLRFDLTRVARSGGTADSMKVVLHGALKLHGVAREVDLPGTVQFSGANIRVHSDFPVNLKEYQIGGLSKMLGMLKMYENIEVHCDLVFAAQP
jgi:polyisoprenoid-binding protein YceI